MARIIKARTRKPVVEGGLSGHGWSNYGPGDGVTIHFKVGPFNANAMVEMTREEARDVITRLTEALRETEILP